MISDVLFINHLFRHTTDAIGTIELNKKLILLSIKKSHPTAENKINENKSSSQPFVYCKLCRFWKRVKDKSEEKKSEANKALSADDREAATCLQKS